MLIEMNNVLRMTYN